MAFQSAVNSAIGTVYQSAGMSRFMANLKATQAAAEKQAQMAEIQRGRDMFDITGDPDYLTPDDYREYYEKMEAEMSKEAAAYRQKHEEFRKMVMQR